MKPNTLRLILALFISGMGAWITYVALPVLVYQRTGSPLLASISLIVKLAPVLVFSPVAGVVVDRCNRWTVMVVGYVTRGALLLVMAMCDTITALIGVAFLVGAVSQFHSPAVLASIPNLEPPTRVVRVNSILEALSSLAMIVGPPLGGVVVGLWGSRSAFGANAVSFFISACLLCTVRIPRSRRSPWTPGSVLQEVTHGFRWLVGNSSLTGMLLLLSAVVLGVDALNALEPVYATQISPQASELAFGMMIGGWGVGMLLGSAYVSSVSNKIRLRTTFLLGITLQSISVGGAAISAVLSVVLGFLVLGGLGNSLTGIALVSILQRSVRDEMRGRVFALSKMLIVTTQVVSMLIWGSLATYLSVRVLLATAGCIAMGATVLGWSRWTATDTQVNGRVISFDPA